MSGTQKVCLHQNLSMPIVRFHILARLWLIFMTQLCIKSHRAVVLWKASAITQLRHFICACTVHAVSANERQHREKGLCERTLMEKTAASLEGWVASSVYLLWITIHSISNEAHTHLTHRQRSATSAQIRSEMMIKTIYWLVMTGIAIQRGCSSSNGHLRVASKVSQSHYALM